MGEGRNLVGKGITLNIISSSIIHLLIETGKDKICSTSTNQLGHTIVNRTWTDLRIRLSIQAQGTWRGAKGSPEEMVGTFTSNKVDQFD